MSGIEIERMLKMIDVSIQANSQVARGEMLRYISEHEDDIANQLRTRGEASIPTSTGMVTIPRSALKATAA